jgi:FKBP-type peptidyl-prolyl cis-trans isomerase
MRLTTSVSAAVLSSRYAISSLSASWPLYRRRLLHDHAHIHRYRRCRVCLWIQGLDEALLGMSTGSIRRVYIPGELAFPKGLASAPGRHVCPQLPAPILATVPSDTGQGVLQAVMRAWLCKH